MEIKGQRIDSDFWQFAVYAGDRRYDFPVYESDPVKALALLIGNESIQEFIRDNNG